jgi:hypothetical protein
MGIYLPPPSVKSRQFCGSGWIRYSPSVSQLHSLEWLRYLQLFSLWSMQWITSLPPSPCLSHHCLDGWLAGTGCAHLRSGAVLFLKPTQKSSIFFLLPYFPLSVPSLPPLSSTMFVHNSPTTVLSPLPTHSPTLRHIRLASSLAAVAPLVCLTAFLLL